MAVLKHTSPTAMPAAPAPLPSMMVPSASMSSAVARSSPQGSVARARGFRASPAGMSGLSFIGFRCCRLKPRRQGLKSGARLAASRPTLLPRVQRAPVLSHGVMLVKLVREIFTCENNELSEQNPLLASLHSITLETSSSIPLTIGPMRETIAAALKARDQGARQAPRLDAAPRLRRHQGSRYRRARPRQGRGDRRRIARAFRQDDQAA